MIIPSPVYHTSHDTKKDNTSNGLSSPRPMQDCNSYLKEHWTQPSISLQAASDTLTLTLYKKSYQANAWQHSTQDSNCWHWIQRSVTLSNWLRSRTSSASATYAIQNHKRYTTVVSPVQDTDIQLISHSTLYESCWCSKSLDYAPQSIFREPASRYDHCNNTWASHLTDRSDWLFAEAHTKA